MKQKTVFFCTDCGTESPKWMGKCPGCGAWNTMTEEVVTTAPKGVQKSTTVASSSVPKTLAEISLEEKNAISHRGKAMRALHEFLKGITQ